LGLDLTAAAWSLSPATEPPPHPRARQPLAALAARPAVAAWLQRELQALLLQADVALVAQLVLATLRAVSGARREARELPEAEVRALPCEESRGALCRTPQRSRSCHAAAACKPWCHTAVVMGEGRTRRQEARLVSGSWHKQGVAEAGRNRPP
jgi:hypothetical protein